MCAIYFHCCRFFSSSSYLHYEQKMTVSRWSSLMLVARLVSSLYARGTVMMRGLRENRKSTGYVVIIQTIWHYILSCMWVMPHRNVTIICSFFKSKVSGVSLMAGVKISKAKNRKTSTDGQQGAASLHPDDPHPYFSQLTGFCCSMIHPSHHQAAMGRLLRSLAAFRHGLIFCFITGPQHGWADEVLGWENRDIVR